MQKYYIHNGVVREGPFNIAELESKSITRYTPVWDQQSNQWTAAQNIQALHDLFEEATRAILKPTPSWLPAETTKLVKKRKTYMEALIIAGIVVLVGCLYAYAVLPPKGSAATIRKSYRLK